MTNIDIVKDAIQTSTADSVRIKSRYYINRRADYSCRLGCNSNYLGINKEIYKRPDKKFRDFWDDFKK